MDGPFYFNHNMFDMMRIDYRIPLNNVEIWTLFDSTMVAHPFHIHDVHFYILDRDGIAPGITETGKKDVVLVKPNEHVRIITKFEDFADTTTPYMYHCHILMHEDDGMMGQFIVTNEFAGVKHVTNSEGVSIYPNPAKDELNISITEDGPARNTTINVVDMLGRQMYSGSFTGFVTIYTSGWPKGVYSVMLVNGSMSVAETVVVE